MRNEICVPICYSGIIMLKVSNEKASDKILAAYFSSTLKATGSTSGISISSALSAMSPYSMAKKTELPVARMYLCAGIRVADPGNMISA